MWCILDQRLFCSRFACLAMAAAAPASQALIDSVLSWPGQVHSCGEAEAIVEDVGHRYRVTVRRCILGQGEFSESMEAERVGAFAEVFLGLQGRQDLELRDRDDADGLGLLGRTVGNYRWLVQSLGRENTGLARSLRVPQLCCVSGLHVCDG